MNQPRCTCAARIARAPPVTPRAPLPHSARSGDRREGARQGRRPATEAPRRTRPPQRATSVLNCGGENHPRCAAPSIDRRFEPRASALLRAGTRPTALDYGGSAGDIVRRRSERVWRVRERSRGYSAERASSPRSQSKIIDDSTHLERRAANCIADSIGRCRLDGGQQLVLDRVSTDRRTFCGGRRVPTEPRSSASLDASGCPHRARELWGTVHRLNAWNECPSVDARRWLMAFPKNNIFVTYKNGQKTPPNSTRFTSTPRVLSQLHAFWSNSTRFGPTPCVSVQLYALAGNSTLWRPTPRSLGQLHALPVNSTIWKFGVDLPPERGSRPPNDRRPNSNFEMMRSPRIPRESNLLRSSRSHPPRPRK